MKSLLLKLILLIIISLVCTQIYYRYEVNNRFIENIMVPRIISVTHYSSGLANSEKKILDYVINKYYHLHNENEYILNGNISQRDYRELAEWFVEKKYRCDWPIIIFNIFIILQILILILSAYYYYKTYGRKYWYISLPFGIIFLLYSMCFWFIGSMHISGSGI